MPERYEIPPISDHCCMSGCAGECYELDRRQQRANDLEMERRWREEAGALGLSLCRHGIRVNDPCGTWAGMMRLTGGVTP